MEFLNAGSDIAYLRILQRSIVTIFWNEALFWVCFSWKSIVLLFLFRLANYVCGESADLFYFWNCWFVLTLTANRWRNGLRLRRYLVTRYRTVQRCTRSTKTLWLFTVLHRLGMRSTSVLTGNNVNNNDTGEDDDKDKQLSLRNILLYCYY
jgi:hypothetical protein